ncbi:MAG: superoxide dismutase [Desulfobacterales bacterium]
MQRREFLTLAMQSGALALLGSTGLAGCGRPPAGQGRIRLPYATCELAPHLSRRTLEVHFGRHHQAYADATLRLAHGTRFAQMPLPDVVQETFGQPGQQRLFHQAAQAYNHAFYWRSMHPEGGGDPPREIDRLLKRGFGGYSGFREQFTAAAGALFGSGWVWLIQEGNRPAIETTTNADTPLAEGKQPLLVIDLWEHAYYLDYQHRRDRYVQAYLDHLINWDFFAANWDRS